MFDPQVGADIEFLGGSGVFGGEGDVLFAVTSLEEVLLFIRRAFEGAELVFLFAGEVGDPEEVFDAVGDGEAAVLGADGDDAVGPDGPWRGGPSRICPS